VRTLEIDRGKPIALTPVYSVGLTGCLIHLAHISPFILIFHFQSTIDRSRRQERFPVDAISCKSFSRPFGTCGNHEKGLFFAASRLRVGTFRKRIRIARNLLPVLATCLQGLDPASRRVAIEAILVNSNCGFFIDSLKHFIFTVIAAPKTAD
jgi:hypothetical protein